MIKKIALLVSLFIPLSAMAQNSQDTWPTKAITFVVPYPPGGPTDLMARLLATPLAEKLAVPVVVENRAGASGNIGTGQVVRATPDGHTILLTASGNLSVNQFLYSQLGFDPVTDLAPIIQISKFPLVLEVPVDSDIQSFEDYLELVKQSGNSASFGSASNGSPQHLAGELFKNVAEVEIMHVPYRGAGPALIDLMGGQITSMFDILGSSISHIEGGRLRPLAVTTKNRSSMLPEVPSISELGYPDFEYYAWHGISTTAGTPEFIIDRLNTEIRAIFDNPEFQVKWEEIGSEIIAGTSQEFDSFIKAEVQKMEPLIQSLNIQID